MKRFILKDLRAWLEDDRRKPAVLRGARQVGKTWLIRELARVSGLPLVELNFERHPDLADIFKQKTPEKIIADLERFTGKGIDTQTSILFLDEIQKAPEAFANLRWFYEEMPGMPVVATGSLLDFVLKDHEFSMPVGRLSYFFLEPMSFSEFIQALGEVPLVDYIKKVDVSENISDSIHTKLMQLFQTYLVIGGMPAVVQEWVSSKSPVSVAKVQQDLINTYVDDFSKYAKTIPPERLRKVLLSVPKLLGQKFKYSHVDRNETTKALNQALAKLCLARLCHKVHNTPGTGVPLASEANEKMFKVILVDNGLASALQGLVLKSDEEIARLVRANKGGIAEQAVGQMLRISNPSFVDPQLHYYVREKRGSSAEIDYLIEHGSDVIPLEVKAGSTGSLKSLHQFMSTRGYNLAVRINAEKPSLTNVNVITTSGENAKYKLLSLPFYLTEEIDRLLR